MEPINTRRIKINDLDKVCSKTYVQLVQNNVHRINANALNTIRVKVKRIVMYVC